MAQVFRVKSGGSILCPPINKGRVAGPLLKPGQLIVDGEEIRLPNGKTWPALPRTVIDQHLQSGYLEMIGSRPEPVLEFTENPPGTQVPPPTRAGDRETGLDHREAIRINSGRSEATHDPGASVSSGGVTSGPVSTGKESGSGVRQVNSLWTLDPSGLQGKSVDELNVMVQERDQSVQPFTDAEEAIAWLSQDYDPSMVKGESATEKTSRVARK